MRSSWGTAALASALLACAPAAHEEVVETTGAETTPIEIDAAVVNEPAPDPPPPLPPAPEPTVDAGPPAPTPAAPRTDLPSVGPVLDAPDATDTEVDAAWNSFLTSRAHADCSMDTPLRWLHDGCRAVRPRRVSSSGDPSTLVAAFDLDACTTFTAGPSPQVVEIELARTETLDLVVIDPGPHASGPSRHVIETQDARGRWIARTVLFGGYYDGVLYALRFPSPITTRRLRIRTVSGPGVVEHREIVPVACEGEVAIHIDGIPPDPPYVAPAIDWHDPGYTHVPNTGRCHRDADCAPTSCCGGNTCGPRRTAPDCSGVGCPADCATALDCGHGACICDQGTCSLATTFAPDDWRVQSR